jgi:hypothetical protein
MISNAILMFAIYCQKCLDYDALEIPLSLINATNTDWIRNIE